MRARRRFRQVGLVIQSLDCSEPGECPASDLVDGPRTTVGPFQKPLGGEGMRRADPFAVGKMTPLFFVGQSRH
jgi:hypothetical protein